MIQAIFVASKTRDRAHKLTMAMAIFIVHLTFLIYLHFGFHTIVEGIIIIYIKAQFFKKYRILDLSGFSIRNRALIYIYSIVSCLEMEQIFGETAPTAEMLRNVVEPGNILSLTSQITVN
jgi:hypothetical protein